MPARLQPAARPATPTCPTTAGGIPVRLLVDAAPRSGARRALPILLFVLLAAGLAAVAFAGGGSRPAARAPAGERPGVDSAARPLAPEPP